MSDHRQSAGSLGAERTQAPARRGLASMRDLAGVGRYSAAGLGALALMCALAGGGLLLAAAIGLSESGVAEGGWLLGCGLVSAALAAVAAGLSLAAERLDRSIIGADFALVTLHGRAGEVIQLEHADGPRAHLPDDAFAGQGLFDRVLVPDRPAFLNALSAATAGANPAESLCEVRLRCEAEGAAPDFVWMEMRCLPAGEERARVLWRDIHVAKLQAEADHVARAEAERANLAKSRFLAAMSHELRTPLNTILGFSELLATDTDQRIDPRRKEDYARIIHESGQHLLGVVNDILDLSRVEAGAYELSFEAVDVPQLVDGCVEMIALDAARRSIKVTSILPARLPRPMADARAVRQMVLNLLSNAVKFSEHGGHVEVNVSAQNGVLGIAVRDAGAGMTADELARLGEPFYQTGDAERRARGSGLGLAVVRALVQLHDGAFDVASTVGGGTTVTVSLPVKRSPSVLQSVVAPFSRAGEDDVMRAPATGLAGTGLAGLAGLAGEGRRFA
ncbi:sensor histidine kinase [Azorhizobium oxalatiphilum]|uniref:sensor histidine kinase n=1 Tax=Azorhizobium oxalatiphilum TaxID=980631 RepID=UPI001662C42B|nr:HAMP domain-containing sensor histidine kinase [Azorhizobium oxalatiphilum]